MEHKKAINTLLKTLDKYPFNTEEKEAILIAIGTLDCGSLIDNRIKGIIKSRKNKLERDIA